MSRSIHYPQLPTLLHNYAEERGLEFHQYSKYHMRLIYSSYISTAAHGETVVCLDVWTTAKYWVKETTYLHGIVERAGETGQLPVKKKPLYAWLDKLFFILEIQEDQHADRTR